MQIPTHILSGWCAANYLRCGPRQRLLAMVAATACDVDGISILFGHDAYWRFHHTFGHNLFFAVIASALLAAISPQKPFSFVLYLALFHLHLLLDYFGSGPGWDIHYLWPLHEPTFTNRRGWPFYSWQNLSFFFVLLLWTLWIAWRHGRTPLERIAPRLDRLAVACLRGRRGQSV